ncbi:MAG: DUF1501 domain-containing protein [Pirellulales bacterium]
MLRQVAHGFGAVAATALMHQWQSEAAGAVAPWEERQPHFAGRAKHVIFLYMDGGPSQVDTFDYKPMLERFDGQDPHQAIGKLEPTQFNNVGKVMKSPWKFRQVGAAGHWVSDLFPHLARQLDRLAFVKSMTSKFPEHTSANYFLHTGSGIQGRPSMGSWVGYGLGTENQNLPGFVVLNGGLIPPGGLDNFNSGFLPASYQASIFNAQDQPVANIQPLEGDPRRQQHKLGLLRQLDQQWAQERGPDDQLETAILNYETAFRMQTAIPKLVDLSQETAATRALYGLDQAWEGTRTFGRQCLIARRLVEQGVRFIELTCPGGAGDRWDQHGGLYEGHTKNCLSVDQPMAALLEDLDQRGLLGSTLVVWAGEFGRTPFAQGSDGRDHNPLGFTIWMAGAGIKGGASVGATDEWGYRAVEDRLEIHDLHATMFHLLGLDHTRVTFRFGGRDMRLTDVHGRLIDGVLA